MAQKAKLILNGRSQATRLPAAFRFDASDVSIRRNPVSSDLILSRRPPTWDGFFAASASTNMPDEFVSERERDQGIANRDSFAGCRE